MYCNVCNRPDLIAIEDAMTAGASVRVIETRFGVSKSAVARHRQNCLAPKVAAAAKLVTPRTARQTVERAKNVLNGDAVTPEDVITLTALLSRVARSLDRLEGAAEAAAADNLHTALAAVSGQLHRGFETAAKLQGIYSDTPQPAQTPFSITINLPNVASTALRDVTPRLADPVRSQ